MITKVGLQRLAQMLSALATNYPNLAPLLTYFETNIIAPMAAVQQLRLIP
ncbi:hypothetical protein ACIQXV_20790 [Neobacillus sp. NPDC097160]